MTESTYTLDTGILGSTRLKIMNEVLNPHTMSFIKNNCELVGKKVLEIACGVGELACEVAQEVGSVGSVLGLDSSETFIDIATETAKKRGLNHLKFQQMDLKEIGQLGETFDLIYLRAILCHLQGVKEILSELTKLLKPKGVLICEESATSQAFVCYPKSSIYDQWAYEFRKEMANVHKTDFDIGYKLLALGTQVGLKLQEALMYQPFLTNARHKKLISLSTREVLPLLIAKKRYSIEEGEKLLKELEAFEQDDSLFPAFIRIAQVAFCKP